MNRKSKQPTLLVDASIYIFQYYFSLPDHWFSEREGYPTAAVYGYFTFLLRLLEAERPLRIAACFDESLGSCFRNEIYPNYKISRAPPDAALAFQLDACREITELLNIASFSSATYEADDLLGTLYKKCTRTDTSIAVLTRDKDLGQLLSRKQDFLWDYAKNGRFYRQHIQQKFGVWPEQLADYLALVGDSIDDIPGVPGIGGKTAQRLLMKFESLKNLYQNTALLTSMPIRGARTIEQKLLEHKQQVLLARQLATIVTNVKGISCRALNWRARSVSLPAIEFFCQRMGFSRLSARVEKVFSGLLSR